MQRDQVTAWILAGGKATRMGGVDKRELVIEDGELRAIDPHLRALHNVHAPEDMDMSP